LARRVEARRVRPATSRIQLDRDDCIAGYPARAQRWIQMYFDDLPRAPRRLPDSIQQWLALARCIRSGGMPEHVAAPLVVRRFGRQLTIYLAAEDKEGATELLFEERTDPQHAECPPELPLTRREREVLLAVERGKHNVEVAAELGMRPRTVKKHLEHIFDKLGVDNRTAAVARLHAVGHRLH
jgi:DNA-binding CsgD family transcriptional regulator